MHRGRGSFASALLRPFVVAAVGTFIAWSLVEDQPNPGDTWGIRYFYEVPFTSGVVGLIAGRSSAWRRGFAGGLSALIGFGVGLLVTQVALHESSSLIGVGLVLGAVPFTIGYAVMAGLTAWRYRDYEPVRDLAAGPPGGDAD
jgi:hypothetical protein